MPSTEPNPTVRYAETDAATDLAVIGNRIEASEWASQNGLFRPDEKPPLESGEQIDNFNIPSDNEEAAA